jgi:superfamily II DNA or RNA helicase
MTELLQLRPYQRDAITAVFGAIDDGTMRPAVVLPTGAGKTVIFSWLANEWLTTWKPGTKVLILVHRDELVDQTVKALTGVAPGLRVGVVKAERDEHIDRDVIVGSVQTLRKLSRRAAISGVGLVIVDEAHHAAAQSYVDVLDHFGCFASCDCDSYDDGYRSSMHRDYCRSVTGATPAVGFSATLTRDDGKSLRDVWDEVVVQRDILDMIPEYLVDVRPGKLITVNDMSLQQVRMQGGDLASSSLSKALLTSDAVNAVVRARREHASNMKTLVFVPSVEAAHVFTDALIADGVRAAAVWGAMPKDERKSVRARFTTGEIELLVNCMVLTEGFDEPSASCVIIARPTASAALYVQMVGRVLRKFPGKTEALVLDVVGATEDHRLATIADLTDREIKLRDGETLATAAIREREEGNPSLANYVISSRDVDLFKKSPATWFRTHEGVWFIQTRCPNKFGGRCRETGVDECGNHLWFVWPDDNGSYSVGVRPTLEVGGRFKHTSVSLDLAMSWAEQYAVAEDSSLANRAASWRRKREVPSEDQLTYARRVGVKVDWSTISKRDLSDLITIEVASMCLDPGIRSSP